MAKAPAVCCPWRRTPAFTLVELLIVIVIVVVLAALSLSAAARSRRTALVASCLSRIRENQRSLDAFADDHGDRYFQFAMGEGYLRLPEIAKAPIQGDAGWSRGLVLAGYLGDPNLSFSPLYGPQRYEEPVSRSAEDNAGWGPLGLNDLGRQWQTYAMRLPTQSTAGFGNGEKSITVFLRRGRVKSSSRHILLMTAGAKGLQDRFTPFSLSVLHPGEIIVSEQWKNDAGESGSDEVDMKPFFYEAAFGRGNVGYVDGHVESLPGSRFAESMRENYRLEDALEVGEVWYWKENHFTPHKDEPWKK